MIKNLDVHRPHVPYRIGFDGNGDVSGYETFVWWRGGDYAPVEPGELTE
jgi:hypothetical protein